MIEDWWPREIVAPANEAERDAVRVAQRVLGVDVTGEMDAPTTGHLRGLQRLLKLPVTGTLNKETALAIDKLRPWELSEE